MYSNQLIFSILQTKLNQSFLCLSRCWTCAFALFDISPFHYASDVIIVDPSLHLQDNIFDSVNILDNLVSDHWISMSVNLTYRADTSGWLHNGVSGNDSKINFIYLMLQQLRKMLDIDSVVVGFIGFIIDFALID